MALKWIGTLVWAAFIIGAGNIAEAATDGGLVEHAKSKLHGTDYQSKQDLKAFGEDFDSNQALKTSQAAVGTTPSDHQFLNRRGKQVKLSNFRGKPLVISLVYTSCFHICPTTTQNLARAANAAESAVNGADKFNVVTIGFDAHYDTPERMRSYAHQQGVSTRKNWEFLSADEATIAELSRELGFIFVPSSKGFDHLIQTSVLDADGVVYRQIYGMDFDPARLTSAVKELVYGLSPELLDLSSLVARARLYCTIYDPASGTYRFNYGMIFGMLVGLVTLSLTGFFVYRLIRRS